MWLNRNDNMNLKQSMLRWFKIRGRIVQHYYLFFFQTFHNEKEVVPNFDHLFFSFVFPNKHRTTLKIFVLFLASVQH